MEEKLNNIVDMISQYQKITSFKRVIKTVNNGVSTKIKRLNVMRGRLYYPAKRRDPSRKPPSKIVILKNTAMNTFQTLEEATDIEIYKRMHEARQREKMIKARAFITRIMSMTSGSYQRALAANGLTNEKDEFVYDENDDQEDYEPSDDEDDEVDEEDEEEFEEEEEIDGEFDTQQDEEEELEFEEQEEDEEDEEDVDEEEVEDDFNVDFEE